MAAIAVSTLTTVACSAAGHDGAATSTSVPAASTTATTTSPLPPTAELLEEIAVGAAYRQGVARVDDGWLFSTNQALYLVDDDLERTVENTDPIPADLLAEGFDHLGDADVTAGIVYAPLEQGDYDADRQLMARYDAATLELLDVTEVSQSHNAWVSVDGEVAYSMSGFTDDTVLRYAVADWSVLPPLRLDRSLHRVQGGDVWAGYLYLSTDAQQGPPATGSTEGDGLYRVDLATGAVVHLGSLTHPDGEGEGIDATPTAAGDLHATSIDPAFAPVWFQHFALRP